MITRQDVADLRAGDVVEISWPDEQYPEARRTMTGPLRASGMPCSPRLCIGPLVVRGEDGDPWGASIRTLTVISRAKPPLYVNSDKTEPDAGDVVRDADGDDARTWAYKPRGGNEFVWLGLGRDAIRHLPDELPQRLRLLVDGRTGQVVQ